MSGLRMICKLYGGITVRENGKTIKYLWDYNRDEPVREEEMKDREKFDKSEKKKWLSLQKQITDKQKDLF